MNNMKKIGKCNKTILIFSIGMIVLLFINYIPLHINSINNTNSIKTNEKPFIPTKNNNLKSQRISSDNIYDGIGVAWNLTHWADRMVNDTTIEFGNNTHDNVKIPFGVGWEANKLNATINNLYDERNWCNGTFSFDNDDGSEAVGDDDTSYTSDNNFQNWTFNKIDEQAVYTNAMSGNYVKNKYSRDCLELSLNGHSLGGSRYGYDQGDKCWWNTSFNIPRGKIMDSEIQFDVLASHLIQINAWELKFHLNDEIIYNIGVYDLREECGVSGAGPGSWTTIKIPQGIWINTTNVFSDPVNNSIITLNVTLEHSSQTCWYEFFLNGQYQQLFLDNIKLVTKAEAKPQQIKLKMNETDINNIDWGKGTIELEGNWQADYIYCNFSSDDVWNLSSYVIELKTDLHLFAKKGSPETNNETNYDSIGTIFSINNDSVVEWDCYAYISVPNEYEETEMRINFPEDINITWISSPQDPGTNQLKHCFNSTPGLLIVSAKNITTISNGYWRLKGISNNYLDQLDLFKNGTSNPNDNIWNPENSFLSGDYINITAKITDSPLISGYINKTKASLYIRFPNGTIWTALDQSKSPDANGYIYFDYFKIPTSSPNYVVGKYEAIITWNNSYSSFGLNETGVICKEFTVIHDSILSSEQVFYEDYFNGDIINLKILFNDIDNLEAIEDAKIYLDDFIGGRQFFSEISPGYYFLEFNTSGGIQGNNSLTIYANSSYYNNKELNVTIELVNQTLLSAEEYPSIQVPWNENFTIHLNYTEKSSGIGIITNPTNNWDGETFTIMEVPGIYNITLNSSEYNINTLHSLIINTKTTGYETQSILINVLIIERDISINEIYLNGLNKTIDKSIELPIGSFLNITMKYTDLLTGFNIDNATVQLIGEGLTESLKENKTYKQYSIILNTTKLNTTGIKFLKIYAQKTNFSISSTLIRIDLENIRAEIITQSRKSVVNIEPGDSYTLKIILNDLIFSRNIKNATVYYYWEFGSGEIKDSNSDGVYEITLSEIPKGTFTITITAIAGNDYQFDSYKITINAQIPEEEESYLWLILLLLSIIAIISMIGIGILIKSKKEIREKESEIALLRIQRGEITEDDILLSKERHFCLVHKGPIEGYIFRCECGAFYCDPCMDKIQELENECWSCGIHLIIPKLKGKHRKERILIPDRIISLNKVKDWRRSIGEKTPQKKLNKENKEIDS